MNSKEPTVFVVDDDEAVRQSLTMLVETVGLNVQTYSSAEDFLDAFDPAQPGCLVLDVPMAIEALKNFIKSFIFHKYR